MNDDERVRDLHDDETGLDLPDYVPGGAVALTDAERWPALTAGGAAALHRARSHPAAPVWVHETGDRLTADDHAALAARQAELEHGPAGDWLPALVERVHRTVPRYRSRGVDNLADVVPVTRADLVAQLAGFVPVDVPLDRVLQGTSSGSTGSALIVPLHPLSVAADLVLLQHLLASCGVDWHPDPDRLGLLSVVSQRSAFTYASAMTVFGDAAMARVNLHPSSWRRPRDREAYLAGMDPQVVTTSPWPLLELADLGVPLRPIALVCGAAALSAGTRERVRTRWPVPLLDVYGLRETGPVAVSVDGGPHVVVPGRVHVDVLGADGRALPDGQRGEVTVTTEGNPYLPLLRYRTGDTAALVREGGRALLVGLEGRVPVRLRRGDGSWVEQVEVTQQLQAHGVLEWHVHQHVDGRVTLRLHGGDDGAVRALGLLLGVEVAASALTPPRDGSKPRRCTSDVPDAVV